MSDVAMAPGRRSGISALAILIILEAALVITWSAGFVGIRFAIDHAPIFLILLWRSLISGLVLLPFALAIGPRLRWKDVLAQMLFGALAMSGYRRVSRWRSPTACRPGSSP